MIPAWWLVVSLMLSTHTEPTTLAMPFATWGACREALVGVRAEWEGVGFCVTLGGERT